jgi:hypothetical protein
MSWDHLISLNHTNPEFNSGLVCNFKAKSSCEDPLLDIQELKSTNHNLQSRAKDCGSSKGTYGRLAAVNI